MSFIYRLALNVLYFPTGWRSQSAHQVPLGLISCIFWPGGGSLPPTGSGLTVLHFLAGWAITSTHRVPLAPEIGAGSRREAGRICQNWSFIFLAQLSWFLRTRPRNWVRLVGGAGSNFSLLSLETCLGLSERTPSSLDR